MLTLEILVIDEPRGTARMIFDQIQQLAATRTQSALVNYLDSGPRTAQAEIVNWIAQDIDNVGLVFVGQLDFYLADPWFYGATVSGSVVPNAGLALGSRTTSGNMSGPKTAYTLTFAAGQIVSGQPILVFHATQGSTGTVSSITDTFSTPYTWTKVDGANTYQDMECWIGTGGVGTSGVITVNAPSAVMGGCAQGFIGASTAAGLSAIDGHTHQSGTVAPTMSITPTANFEIALAAIIGNYPAYAAYVTAFPPATLTGVWIPNYTIGIGEVTGFLAPTSGVVFQPSASLGGSPTWDGWMLAVKGSGAAVSLSLTNPGTVLAENALINILGPMANPTITNLTNSTSVTIATTVASTKHLIVNAAASTAVNDGTNVVGSVSHSGAEAFLTLSPGVNVLQVSGASCTGSTLVSVSFAAPYE
jgi:hypothetical protein